jgi:hypothetical protein
MYLIMAFPSNYVSFGRSKNDTPASSTKRKWTENLAVGIESLSLDYALLENRSVVSFFGRGEG